MKRHSQQRLSFSKKLSKENMLDIDLPNYERRFSGVRRLYGQQGFVKLQAAHVCVIGIGGVGSWAVEALSRSAVGHITLIDLDNIAESNVNRQLHAIDGAFGMAKVTAMAHRIKAINPACVVQEIEDFVTPENVAEMLSGDFDMVLDAIDDAKAKVAIAAYCKKNNISLVTVGGAGGRLDPTKIKQADLSQVVGDRLLAKCAINCAVTTAFLRRQVATKIAHLSLVSQRFIQTRKFCNPKQTLKQVVRLILALPA